jgi:hypothetical protein
MNIPKLPAFFAGLFLILISCATTSKTIQPGIGEIYGYVMDDATNEPLNQVDVYLVQHNYSVRTNYRGLYSLKELGSEKFTLQFTREGYQPVEISNVALGYGEHYKLDVWMSKNVETRFSASETGSPTHDKRGYTMSAEKPAGESGNSTTESEPATKPAGEPVISVERKTRFYTRQTTPLTASAHDDNEEYPYYLEYLQRYEDISNVYHRDFNDRFIIRVTDWEDNPLFNIPFQITDVLDTVLWNARTVANGESVLFPRIMFAGSDPDELYVKVDYRGIHQVQKISKEPGEITTMKLAQIDNNSDLSLDILFILDATGSMGDEIQQLQDNIYSIHTRIKNFFHFLPMRFGLVLYRDRGDKFLVRKFDFTDSIDEFQLYADEIKAGGGGDNPEDVQTALKEALQQMSWSDDAVKLSFLMADAPPHLDYNQDYTYLNAALDAQKRGIKIYTIGASGLNVQGEYIFRQISALTYSQFIFLTYGERGESEGIGTGKVSHHTGDNFESHNLDDLVVNIVKKEISYQMSDDQIARKKVEPALQEGYLKIRLGNLWAQIIKGMGEALPDEPVCVLAPFKTEYGELSDLADYLMQQSTVSLLESRGLKLVERERLDQILEEKGLSLAGIIQQERYDDLFQLLKSNVIFLGDLTFAGIDPVIFMRAVRTDNAELVAAARIRL